MTVSSCSSGVSIPPVDKKELVKPAWSVKGKCRHTPWASIPTHIHLYTRATSRPVRDNTPPPKLS